MKLLVLVLAFCAGLRADVTFSTGYTSAPLIRGLYGDADTISLSPVNGVAQDGETLPVPLLAYSAGCYRTDQSCLYTYGSATVTVPVTLTNWLGQSLTESLSYTAGVSITQEGYHYLSSGPGSGASFVFDDGENWIVTEPQSLNGKFHDWDRVSFGSLSFAEPVAVPEPNGFLVEVALFLCAIAALKQGVLNVEAEPDHGSASTPSRDTRERIV